MEENVLFSEYRQDMVHHYFNLSHKIPVRVPRKIYKYTGFVCLEKLKCGYKLLWDKIRKDDDLLPNLSRQIFDPTYRDYMLYDFGIVHFHLGIKPSKKNPLLIESTNEVVYALIDCDICYFIRIDEHNKWDDISLLEKLKKISPKYWKKGK